MQRLRAIEGKMLATPDLLISLTDPDSLSMAASGRGSAVVGYNVQLVGPVFPAHGSAPAELGLRRHGQRLRSRRHPHVRGRGGDLHHHVLQIARSVERGLRTPPATAAWSSTRA